MSKSEALHIMIVEDDDMVMSIIEDFIYKIPKTEVICKAYNLSSAKKCLESETIDLVLIDIFLPDGNGIDLLKWIRIKTINVDAIMITADQRSSSLESARRYGVYDYILKPFKFERFQEAIDVFRKRKHLIDSDEHIKQHVVDRIITNKDSAVDWKNQTYELILAYLKDHSDDSYTSSEIANLVGISRITARKYLEAMELEGVVGLELSYGNVGRPKNKYSYARQRNEY